MTFHVQIKQLELHNLKRAVVINCKVLRSNLIVRSIITLLRECKQPGLTWAPVQAQTRAQGTKECEQQHHTWLNRDKLINTRALEKCDRNISQLHKTSKRRILILEWFMATHYFSKSNREYILGECYGFGIQPWLYLQGIIKTWALTKLAGVE